MKNKKKSKTPSEVNNNQVVISESLRFYAESIATRVLNNNLTKESFAIGITGGWGTGKTTFLNTIKSKLVGKAEVVEFNPWMCSTAKQVVEDFFTTLRKQLSRKNKRLASPIRKYAQKLDSVSLSLPFGVSIKFPNFISKESLSDMKDNLSAHFSKLKQPVVVLIDDLDRLEGDEVFEALRLIRNTADLKNVVYVATYDKDYVVKVLNEKQIKNASDYLEKIFPMELHLPKVEDWQLWDKLLEEVTLQNRADVETLNKIVKSFTQDDRKLILTVLNSYRRVLRFAQLVTLNIQHLCRNKEDFNLQDAFWLELLQVYDKTVYDTLSIDPNKLLYVEKNQYFIRDGIASELPPDRGIDRYDKEYRDEKIWENDTPKILFRIFSHKSTEVQGSICHTENYDNYFTLSVSPFKLSVSEFIELLNCETGSEKIVNEWLKEEKYMSSILFLFSRWSVEEMTEKQLQNYIEGLLLLCCNGSEKVERVEKIRSLFHKSKFSNKESVDSIKTIMTNWFNDRINASMDCLPTSSLLKMLYDSDLSSWPPPSDNPLESVSSVSGILSNEDICCMLRQIITNYLETHFQLTALDVIVPDGEFGQLVRNCCVVSGVEYLNDVYSGRKNLTYKQIASDIILKHFAAAPNPPAIHDYVDALGKMLGKDSPLTDSDKEELLSCEFNNPFDMFELERIFGNNYKEFLSKFKEDCFKNDNQKNT